MVHMNERGRCADSHEGIDRYLFSQGEFSSWPSVTCFPRSYEIVLSFGKVNLDYGM